MTSVMPRGPARVLVLTTSYPRWKGDPAGSFVLESVMALRAAGAQVKVLAPDDPEAEPAEDVERVRYHRSAIGQHLTSGAGIPDLLERHPRHWAEGAGLTCRLLQRALSTSADLVVGHWLLPGGALAACVGKIKKIPSIAVAHSGGVALAERLPGRRLLARQLAEQIHRWVFVNEALQERFCDLLDDPQRIRVRQRSRVQPMGHLAEEAASSPRHPSDPFIVGFVGRLVPIKGVSRLVRALSAVSGARLRIAGDGPLRSEILRTAERLAVPVDHCATLEHGDIPQFMAGCHALALPSVPLANGRCEGTPVSLLEAMAVGRPVIASATGGIPEFVAHGQNGLLVQAGDEVQLAHALRSLRDDPRWAEALGRNAATCARRWRWSTSGPGWARWVLEGAQSCAA